MAKSSGAHLLPDQVNEVHTAKHRKKVQKVVKRHEVEKSDNGGYIVTKHFHDSEGAFHQPERHVAKNRQEALDILKSI